MRSVVLVFLVLVALIAQPAAGIAGLLPVPPSSQAPTDPDGDGKYEDLNANTRKDFADVVLYFNRMSWIAANEPVVAFDYNGNARIDFADVVSLFNELGSGPTPTPTAGGSVSQVVNPSDADQTVRLDASTAVIIPGGLLTAPQTITIQRELTPPAPTRDGDQVLNAVRVSIGALHTFSREVPIEMPFDPSTVPSGTDPASIIQGAYWDTETGAWVPLPSTVDTARRVVTVYTTHLSLIGDIRAYMDLPSVEGVHFRVHYDPKDDAYAKAYDAAHTFASAQAMAAHCAAVLDSGYADYTGQGFRPPVPGTLDVNRIRVFVGRYDGGAFWSGKTGRIFIPVVPDHFDRGVGGLDRELRHELFHAVQNRYWTVGTMYIHRWWTEATAEYASGGRPLPPPTFILQPLTYDPDINDQHKYQAAAFIGYVQQTYHITFADIWNHTSAHNQVYASLDPLLRTNAGVPLSRAYADFIENRIWVPGNDTWPVDVKILDGSLDTMDLGEYHRQRYITVPAGGATRIWGIDIENYGGYLRGRSILGISTAGGLPDGLSVRIQSPEYRETIYGEEGSELLAFQGTETIPGSDDDRMYIVLTNTGTSDRTIGVSVDEAHTTMTPTVLSMVEGDWGKTPVHFAVDNIPLGVDTVQFCPAYPHMVTETGHTFVNVTVNGGRAEITYYLSEGMKTPGDYEGDIGVACFMGSSHTYPSGIPLDDHRFTYTIVPKGI